MAEDKQCSKRVAESLRLKGAYDKVDNSTGRKEKSIETGGDEEKVMCFCGEDRKFGEMACCELCAGWFPFCCIRFKEDVDMLAKKDFVCCFCLAAKTLFLLREVEVLKNEVKELCKRNSAKKGEIQTNENVGKQRLFLATRRQGYTRSCTVR